LELIVLGGDNYSVEGTTLTPDENYYGPLQVGVKVSDPTSTSNTFQATVIVNSVNDPPIITGQKSTLEAKHLITLEVLVSDLYFEDVDNNLNQLSVKIQPDPEEVYLANGNNLTVVKDTMGIIEVAVVLDDGQDYSNEFLLQVNVLAAYNPPQFTTQPPKEATTGEAYFYLVDAVDPDEGDVLSYSASTLPGWLNFNEDMKLLGGSPSTEDTGKVWVGLEVTDGMFVVEQLYELEVKLYTSFGIEHLGETQSPLRLIDKIYPVPASERIYLHLDHSGDADIQIINASGLVVLSKHHMLDPDADIRIDLEGLNPGIYFIRVSSGERTDTRKFIIRK
jgi:hypothetical protein